MGDHYLLNGTKNWITSADSGSVYLVIAQTHPEKGHKGIQQLKYSPFPVVAAPYGMVLGGGCETCLGADRIVAHSELYMGLVEIGVGLLPAGGGCLNLWKKMVGTLPAAVKDADLAKFFIPTFMAIAMAKVSMSATQARPCRSARETGCPFWLVNVKSATGPITGNPTEARLGSGLYLRSTTRQARMPKTRVRPTRSVQFGRC